MSNEAILRDSDGRDFFEALAAVNAGDLTLVGERYDERGVREILVRAPGGTRRNPEIRIGAGFFSSAIKDYEDWMEKWWREAIQNAVDAGATEVECTTLALPDGTFRIACSDNGKGMDEDTILTKFLVLGATTKIVGGTTGGFGKAKELLLLPWLKWSIHSRTTQVNGEGIEYQVSQAPARSGTELAVIMPADKTTTEAAAISFISKCYIPKVRFTVNGRDVKADLEPGELVDDWDGKADVYHNPGVQLSNSQMLVRTGGLYSFGIWLSSGVPGVMIVELKGRSVDLLTANRDGFRDRNLKYAAQDFVNQLAADISSKLKKKAGGIRQRFKGKGKFKSAEDDLKTALFENMNVDIKPKKKLTADQIEEFVQTVQRQLPEHEKVSGAPKKLDLEPTEEIITQVADTLADGDNPGNPLIFGDGTEAGFPLPRGAVDEVEDIVDQVAPDQPEAEIADDSAEGDESMAGPIELAPIPDAIRVMLGDINFRGSSHLEAALTQVAWEPDFFIINEKVDEFGGTSGEIYPVAKQFMPQTMSANVRKLARLWAELCRFVLIQLGCEKNYGIGWIFAEKTLAAYLREDGENWLLLNPFRMGVLKRKKNEPEMGKIYRLSAQEDLDMLYACAVHECTHMASGFSLHNESFASALTLNIAYTTGRGAQVKAIRKAIGSRKFKPGKM